jgi:hypothetical protein
MLLTYKTVIFFNLLLLKMSERKMWKDEVNICYYLGR